MRINNLKVNYPNRVIEFKDYEFKHGVTVVSGRNGTGKTTLFKALAGLMKFEGTITNGKTVTYVAQEPILFNRSSMENILYSSRIKKSLINETRIMDLSIKFSVDMLLSKNATKLSSGEKIKISIIRGIMYNPEILLLDEPTTHMDLESIDELIKVIKSLKKEMDIYIISHNKSFIDEVVEHEYSLGE